MSEAVIVTFSGMEFDVLNPNPDKILLIDIAHALSQTCRFTGHTSRFYSVAEHSVLCSECSDKEQLQRALLLHDAAETYLNDIASPVKKHLMKYNEIEEILLATIFIRFDILDIPPWHKEIKFIDRGMLQIEISELMPQTKVFTSFLDESPLVQLNEPINCWHPEYAKKMFLRRAKELKLED